MKFQLKLLALAVIGLVATAPVHASIARTDSGNGELFLSVWDNNGTVNDTSDDRSYTRDLGSVLSSNWTTTTNTPVFNAVANTAGTTKTYGADALFSTWLGAAKSQGNLQWNVFGGDSVGANKYLSTVSTFPVALDQTALHNWGLATDTYLAAVNAKGGDNTPALNGSITATPSDGNAFAGGVSWSQNVGTTAQYGFSNAGGIGSQLAFWAFYETSSVSGGEKTFQYASRNDNGALLHNNAAATWTLDSTGTLTYAVPVSAVPVPAAVWLLGSGLIGLVGVSRRRKAA